MRYLKKPVEVDMIQWRGDNLAECQAFADPLTLRHVDSADAIRFVVVKGDSMCMIHVGDWIARERDGFGFYPIIEADQRDSYVQDGERVRLPGEAPIDRLRTAFGGASLTPAEGLDMVGYIISRVRPPR